MNPLDDIKFLEDGYGDDCPGALEPKGWDHHEAAERIRGIIVERDCLRDERDRLQQVEESLVMQAGRLLNENSRLRLEAVEACGAIARELRDRRRRDDE